MPDHLLKALVLLLACSFVIMANSSCGKRENLLPYKNSTLSIQERVDDLIARMTLEEKVSQMMNSAPAIERLGVPEYNWWNECLHGVGRSGKATVFPQAIGLAATWDTDLMHRVATVISDEARAKHHEYVRHGKRGIYQGLTFWSPNLNLFRDPRWGRGMETYGEDPYLTGKMAVAFIKGLQGDDPKYLKVVATAKHYAVHSGPEPSRHEFDAQVDERNFRDSYLPHFEASIREGHAYSVMCAYNRFRGEACCGSSLLLTDILRNEWGFDGYVVSDCGAIEDISARHKVVETLPQAAALAVKSGCDLCCGEEYQGLLAVVKDGDISEAEIDAAVRRLFVARFKLGMFDPPEMVPYAQVPYSVLDSEAHQRLALEAARKSVVLLKNERNLLPLKKDLKSIAVIGPNADDVEVLLGNYNGFPSNPVTPLQGIRQKVSPATKVAYSLGCEWAENLPYFEVIPSSALFTSIAGQKQNGLTAEYYSNNELNGEPLLTRVDEQIDFNWWDDSPDSRLNADNFAVRWSGELVPPGTGGYALGGYGLSGFRIYLDDSLLVKFSGVHHPSKTYKNVSLQAGRSYKLEVEYFEKQGHALMQLLWSVPKPDLEAEALQAAKQAEVVVLVMGLSPRLEGEEMRVPVQGFAGGDRLTLDLPALQERLMKKIAGLGKPTVLVLLNGSALAVNWASEHVPAIVEAWYPGQAGGTAISDVLFGDYNPGGRLPVTFYQSVDQLPPFEDYRMQGHTYRYFAGEPLYPFGYGLSYTKFAYSDLQLPESVRPDQNVVVTAKVENVGRVVGEEVVQLYVKDVDASVPMPIRSLQGVQRILLQPGEVRTVEFTLTPKQLSLLDKDFRRVIEPGVFEITVGGKQPGFSGRADAAITQVLTGRLKVVGETTLVQ